MIELKEGDYKVADGYTYHVSNHIVHIKKKTGHQRKDGDYRCIECAHRVLGRCYKNRRWETFVCEVKPKGDNLFYCAPTHGGRDCKNFERK